MFSIVFRMTLSLLVSVIHVDVGTVDVIEKYSLWIADKMLMHHAGHNVEVPDISCTSFNNMTRDCRYFATQAQDLLGRGGVVGEVDQRRLKAIIYQAERCQELLKTQVHLLGQVNAFDGIQVLLPELFKAPSSLNTSDLTSYQTLLRRLKTVPRFLRQMIDLLRCGKEANVIVQSGALYGIDEQFQRLQVRADESDFFYQFRMMPETRFGPKLITLIQERARYVVGEKVLPAFDKLGNFLQTEYPRDETLSGFGEQSWQKMLVDTWNLCPPKGMKSHHNRLNEELVSLRLLAQDFMSVMGLKNSALVQDFLRRTPISSGFSPRHDMQQSRLISQIKSVVPLDLSLAEVEARLRSTRADSVPSQMHDLGETILGFHERLHGVSTDCAKIIFPINFAVCNFELREGWALYVEDVGLELGLYSEPNELLAYLKRRIRQTVLAITEKGVCCQRWTRQRALAFILDYSGEDLANAATALDKIYAYPGLINLALDAKFRVRDLRRMRESPKTLGKKEHLFGFHRDLLDCFGPIDLLQECLETLAFKSSAASLVATNFLMMLFGLLVEL